MKRTQPPPNNPYRIALRLERFFSDLKEKRRITKGNQGKYYVLIDGIDWVQWFLDRKKYASNLTGRSIPAIKRRGVTKREIQIALSKIELDF